MPGNVVAADLGYQIGPRLNAAGRLDDMSIGIQCLLTDDPHTARLLAARLSQLNSDRKELELQMQQEALLAIADMRAEDPELPLPPAAGSQDRHQVRRDGGPDVPQGQEEEPDEQGHEEVDPPGREEPHPQQWKRYQKIPVT